MSSQITPVQPTSSDWPGKRVLYFDRESFTNFRITDKYNQVIYEARSNSTGDRTKVYEGEYRGKSDVPCVTIERSEVFSDKVKFRDQKSIKVADWLTGGDEISCPIMYQGRKYIWRATGAYYLLLFADPDTENPIAQCQYSQKTKDETGQIRVTPGSLTLREEAQQMVEFVLISQLLVYQKVYRNKIAAERGTGFGYAAYGA